MGESVIWEYMMANERQGIKMLGRMGNNSKEE